MQAHFSSGSESSTVWPSKILTTKYSKKFFWRQDGALPGSEFIRPPQMQVIPAMHINV
ncbi:MAG: hypothetical protein ABIN89_25475 [Chitinophagaceae bacterium]